MRDEIFGPILPIIEFEDLDKELNIINSLDHPLAFYYFGEDKETIQRIYGDGFLDITHLEDLPKNLTVLIKQYLK